jgi:hypothetical protein
MLAALAALDDTAEDRGSKIEDRGSRIGDLPSSILHPLRNGRGSMPTGA